MFVVHYTNNNRWAMSLRARTFLQPVPNRAYCIAVVLLITETPLRLRCVCIIEHDLLHIDGVLC
jgi:hypothetical protein